MNVPAPQTTGTDLLSAPGGIPAQRSADAYTAYASVHQLGVALHRAGEDGPDLRPSA